MTIIYSKNIGALVNASPPKQPSPRHLKGSIRQVIDWCEVPANSADGDIFNFGLIPSEATINWALSKIVWDGAHGASRKFQVGTNRKADAFAANIDCSSASAVAGVPAVNLGIDKIGQSVKELSGVSAEDYREQMLQVKLTGGAGSASASKLGLCIYYT